MRDAWVLKLDASGNVQWAKTYGGRDSDYAYSIQQTFDGGYIVAGETLSFGAGSYDVWVLKLDENGNITDCPSMGTSNATVNTTTVTPADTNATPIDTNATIINTSANIATPTINTTQVCPASVRSWLFSSSWKFLTCR